MHKFIFKSFAFALLILAELGLKAQYISVDTETYTPEELVKNIFFSNTSSNCIEVSNVQINGRDFGRGNTSWGYFNNNNSSFEMEDGIILSTGSALAAVGPNSYVQTENYNSEFADKNWLGDQDLIEMLQDAGLNTKNILNATSLEFDFISKQADKINFEYMFLSEEYQQGNQEYSDAFAFLIKEAETDSRYTNIALVPGTGIPVTSLTINENQNPLYFSGFNDYESPTNFNGQTKILTAKSEVKVGTKYHIKLVIADHGDDVGRYDSAVFLKAGSFVGNYDLGADYLISNGTALCEGEEILLNAEKPGSTYQWLQNGSEIPGATSSTYTVTEAGFYEVEITESTDCKSKGSIQIEYATKPVVSEKTFFLCDDDFDDLIEIQLNDYNSQVISNYNRDFNVRYYEDPDDAEDGNSNDITNLHLVKDSTKTLYVRADNGSCEGNIEPIHFTVNPKITLQYVPDQEICNNNLKGNVEVHLSDYVPKFTNTPNLSVSYYDDETNAKQGKNPIVETATFNSTKTYYFRIEAADFCPNIGKITFKVLQPQTSSTLKDTTTCPNSTAILDAGSGFAYYQWFKAEDQLTPILEGNEYDAQIFNAEIGNYIVRLYSVNGCYYDQNVSVTASETPIITHIEVSGRSATIFVQGGTSPYEYSLDNIHFQSSNVFQNVPRGMHMVYVKSADGCYTVNAEFLIINLINAITPNGDGHNDVLDYSDLRIYNNVVIEIFDRNGATVFKSNGPQYIWDGKNAGRVVSTGTYWYILSWEEPVSNRKISYKGWILVKNRN